MKLQTSAYRQVGTTTAHSMQGKQGPIRASDVMNNIPRTYDCLFRYRFPVNIVLISLCTAISSWTRAHINKNYLGLTVRRLSVTDFLHSLFYNTHLNLTCVQASRACAKPWR